VPVAALVGQDQLAAAGKVVALMVAGILVGLFCVLVGLTLGLWIAYYYWREKLARWEFDQAFRRDDDRSIVG